MLGIHLVFDDNPENETDIEYPRFYIQICCGCLSHVTNNHTESLEPRYQLVLVLWRRLLDPRMSPLLLQLAGNVRERLTGMHLKSCFWLSKCYGNSKAPIKARRACLPSILQATHINCQLTSFVQQKSKKTSLARVSESDYIIRHVFTEETETPTEYVPRCTESQACDKRVCTFFPSGEDVYHTSFNRKLDEKSVHIQQIQTIGFHWALQAFAFFIANTSYWHLYGHTVSFFITSQNYWHSMAKNTNSWLCITLPFMAYDNCKLLTFNSQFKMLTVCSIQKSLFQKLCWQSEVTAFLTDIRSALRVACTPLYH